ncbi:DNA dC-_dU-editing enzyme APOBEC-3G-like [Myotis lucifugus]|uniref:DNA dC->dU-editing enzyme APOBEC-3G-like n=1 Tax=Myotis lucifugus TaxID=59463 RepID=UPI0006D7358D|nr:DNA dC->dU-editing enzyme APOBEC-3G-like [Myotis lucifugus]
MAYKAPRSLKASQEEDGPWPAEKVKELRHGGQPSTNWQEQLKGSEEDLVAPAKPLMDATTFKENFANTWENETELCYEVEVLEGDTWAPVEELQGFLCNQGPCHAELCFLCLVRSWHVDEGKQYRLTWHISWSPCPNCAQKLVKFLHDNSHVSLRIFAAGIQTTFSGHEDWLRKLRDSGAQLAIMTLKELQHCWDTFVDNQGQPFEPWPNLVEHIQTESQKLKDILGNQKN